MAKKSFRKVLSLFVALTMIATLFVGVGTIGASAAATGTKYLQFSGPSPYSSSHYPVMSMATDDVLVVGTKYKFSMVWENIANAPFNTADGSSGNATFWLKAQDNADAKYDFYKVQNYASDFKVTETTLNHGSRFDMEFTYGVGCASGYTPLANSSLMVQFGDIGKKGDGKKFKTANWVLYKEVGGEWVDTEVVPTIDELSTATYNSGTGYRGVSASVATGFVGKWASANEDDNGLRNIVWIDADYSWRISYGDIESGYYDVPAVQTYDTGVYNCGTEKTVRFTKGAASDLVYTNNKRLFTEGEPYHIGFEINDADYTSNGLTVQVKLGDTVQTLDGAEVTNGVYENVFEATDTSADLEVTIGSAGTKELVVAKPYIRTENEDGEADMTAINLIHSFGSDSLEALGDGSKGTDVKKWNRVTGSDTRDNRKVWAYDYSSVTPANYTTGQRVTFGGLDYRLLRYHEYDANIVAGTTYKIIVDYRYFYGDDLWVAFGSDTSGFNKSGVSTTYDEANRKAYYTFTADTNATDFRISIGNSGATNPTGASIGHVGMYVCDSQGQITGDSLIDDINIMTLDWQNTTTEYAHHWNTRGKTTATDGICKSAIPDGYFSANTYTDKAVYFPSGYSNYQVIVYRDPDIRLAAGTYRFIIDKNQICGASTVILCSGESLDSTISKTKIGEDGYTVTYEFTLDAAVRGFGTKIGNYNDGLDSSMAFKCPVLKKYDGSALVGPNLVEPMNDRTLNIKAGISTATAPACYWNSVNHSGDMIQNLSIADCFPDAIVTTGDKLLVGFNEGFSWKQIQYHDTTLALENGKTYEFTVDTKELGASASTFAIATGTAVGTNIFNKAEYMTDCSNTLNGTVRTVRFTMAKTVTDVHILLGNNSDNTDVAVVYANPKLVDVNGSSANLIAGMTTDTVDFTKDKEGTNRTWTTRGYAQSGTASSMYKGVYDPNYFTATPVSKMIYINTPTTGYNWFSTSATLKPSTTYTFEADWRAFGGAVPKFSLSATNTSSSGFASNNATAIDDSGTVSLGHYTATFTTQADLKTDGMKNFSLTVGAYIKGDDWFNNGRGSLYIGNMTLKESGNSRELLANGDLSMNNEVQINDSILSNFAQKWELGNAKHGGTGQSERDFYKDVRIITIPDGFFTDAGPAANKLMQFNGGSYDYVMQSLFLKSNTKYRLTYKYSYVNGLSTQFLEQIQGTSDFSTPDFSVNTYDDNTNLKTMEFTTGANLRTNHDNFRLSFLIPTNGKDISFYFGDVKLYELNGSATTGPNLVNNGGFNFGEPEVITEGLYDESKEQRAITTALSMVGWDIRGSFEQNNSLATVALNENSFPSYIPYADRLTLIVNMLIGKEEKAVTGLTDVNNNGDVDIIDLVKTKKKIANPSGVDVDGQVATWKSQYLNVNNTSAFSVTGTTYYVDATNGSDSRDGKSAANAWKTLDKVNKASLKSGDAVLFKCGEVFRPVYSFIGTAALTTKAGVKYGTYGSGDKPIIVGSLKNYAGNNWTKDSGNVWYCSKESSFVGIMVFNYGASIGNMKLQKADLAQNGDFWESDDGLAKNKIYLYSDTDPDTKYDSIEMGMNFEIATLANNVTIDNICFKYSGKHGLEGNGLSGVTISNCRVSYIGGCYGGLKATSARLGNGIQFGLGASNCTVSNCYVTECYDAGLTFQNWGTDQTPIQNVTFTNNVVENCNYAIEWFANSVEEGRDTVINNVQITNNILRGAGYGWSYDEREGYGIDIGTTQTSLFRVGADRHYNNFSMTVTGNTFDRSKGGLVYWYWNRRTSAADVTPATFEEDVQNGLNIYGNNYYQSSSVENQILSFDKEGFVYGSSTYGLLQGVKRFENTDNPTGNIKYIYTGADAERIIEQ